MLLFASVVLAIMTCFVTWKVAYKMANPSAPLGYSKTVGWVACAAGLPFAAASIVCAVFAVGQSFATAMGVAIFIGMLMASPVGEGMGKRDKANA